MTGKGLDFSAYQRYAVSVTIVYFGRINILKRLIAALAALCFHQNMKEARKDAEKRGITPVCTSEGMVYLRTDGHIWVMDQIKLDVE